MPLVPISNPFLTHSILSTTPTSTPLSTLYPIAISTISIQTSMDSWVRLKMQTPWS